MYREKNENKQKRPGLASDNATNEKGMIVDIDC